MGGWLSWRILPYVRSSDSAPIANPPYPVYHSALVPVKYPGALRGGTQHFAADQGRRYGWATEVLLGHASDPFAMYRSDVSGIASNRSHGLRVFMPGPSAPREHFRPPAELSPPPHGGRGRA